MTEKWQDIPGWKRFYECSDQGRIRSKTRFVKCFENGKGHTRKGRILSLHFQSKYRSKHLAVTLSNGDRRKQYYVHMLVLLTFKGKKKKGQESRHLNGDPTDNRLSNLRYGTPAENQNDRVKHGTSNRKISALTARKIKQYRGSLSNRELAKQFRVPVYTVYQIRSNRQWKNL